MPNRNYQAGTRFERKLKRQFEVAGWVVLRTAGSHGFADLILVDETHASMPVSFIQCKVLQTRKAAERLIKEFRAKPPIRKHDHYLMCLAIQIKEERTMELTWL